SPRTADRTRSSGGAWPGTWSGRRGPADFQDRLRQVLGATGLGAVDSALVLAYLLHPEAQAESGTRLDTAGTEVGALLRTPLQRAQGRERAGLRAVLARAAGPIAAKAREVAERREALGRAEAELEEALGRWQREGRLYTAYVWLWEVPKMVLLPPAVVIAYFAGTWVSGEYAVGGGRAAVGAVLWLGARLAGLVTRLAMGPKEGHPSAVEAAQARFRAAEERVAQARAEAAGIDAELDRMRGAATG